jgi:hypothetical protein
MVVSINMEIEVDRNALFRNLGYKADVVPSARISSLVNEYIEKARDLIEPSYSYVFRDVEAVESPRILVEGPVLFESEAIALLLGKCEKVAIFILTIGSRLEETAGWFADNGLIIEAYVMDAIGSTVVEKLADFVQSEIERAVHAQGLCISRRFSPGHCDWDINQQQMVFHAMKGRWSGVYLTDECCMMPQKSLSGIIGVGPCDNGVDSYNPCETCSKVHCLWRR